MRAARYHREVASQHGQSLKVSVVVTADGPAPRLQETLSSLLDQDFPSEQAEILVCHHGLDETTLTAVQDRYPSVERLEAPDGGYYYLKNFGIQRARGEFIALADSDCVYSRQWLRRIVEALEAGADVSCGLTRLEGHSLLRRLCSFYDQHQMLVRLSPRLRRFVSNNVGFRATVLQDCLYDSRFDRTGGCVHLAERLVRRDIQLRFTREQVALHHFYGYARHTWKQAICSGYDFFHTREVDPQMPLAALTRLPLLAPPLLSTSFVLADLLNVVQNRGVLGIRWYEVPAYAAFSLTVRPIEMVGMYWFKAHPASAARFVRRNFA